MNTFNINKSKINSTLFYWCRFDYNIVNVKNYCFVYIGCPEIVLRFFRDRFIIRKYEKKSYQYRSQNVSTRSYEPLNISLINFALHYFRQCIFELCVLANDDLSILIYKVFHLRPDSVFRAYDLTINQCSVKNFHLFGYLTFVWITIWQDLNRKFPSKVENANHLQRPIS